jgi:hypothetical protein
LLDIVAVVAVDILTFAPKGMDVCTPLEAQLEPASFDSCVANALKELMSGQFRIGNSGEKTLLRKRTCRIVARKKRKRAM